MIQRMKDTYRIWKICRIFHEREIAEEMDAIRIEHPDWTEASVYSLWMNARDYYILKETLGRSYVKRWYPKQKWNIDSGSERLKLDRRLREAEDTIKNCIKRDYIKENPQNKDLVCLTGEGRLFATRLKLLNAWIEDIPWTWRTIAWLIPIGLSIYAIYLSKMK